MESNVLVSVVMPVRNEEDCIAHSLSAVLNQDYPPELTEILVVDGLSNDRTLEIIKTLADAERVRVLTNPCRIQSAGLNAAIRQVRGEIILRIDGHTVIAPDYVRQCVTLLKETGAYNVGGPLNPVGVTPMGRAIASATQSRFAVPGAFHKSSTSQYTDTVYLGAWPRWVLEAVGGFDENLPVNEDYELNYRIRWAGGRIYLSSAIRSHYFGRQTLHALAQQYFRYGKGKTGTLRKYPASIRPRQLVAPTFIGALLGGISLAAIIPLIGWLWLLMLSAYLVATGAFSLAVARRAGYALFWRVPLVFLTIHLAWGVGFWAGLLGGGFHLPRRHSSQLQISSSKDI